MATGSERRRELRRRRHRKQKLVKLHKKVEGANPTEVDRIKDKVRRLTPGADQIFENWGV